MSLQYCNIEVLRFCFFTAHYRCLQYRFSSDLNRTQQFRLSVCVTAFFRSQYGYSWSSRKHVVSPTSRLVTVFKSFCFPKETSTTHLALSVMTPQRPIRMCMHLVLAKEGNWPKTLTKRLKTSAKRALAKGPVIPRITAHYIILSDDKMSFSTGSSMHNVRTNSELQVQDVPVGLFFEGESHWYGEGGKVHWSLPHENNLGNTVVYFC